MKDEYRKWFFSQSPYWPTPDQQFDWLIANASPLPSSIPTEEIMKVAWEAWKEVYRINCTWDGDEFVGYDWSMVELEFTAWWEKQPVSAKIAHTAEPVNP